MRTSTMACCFPFSSVEEALLAGGDARIALDAATGLTAYGSSVRSDPGVVAFASTTANHLTPRGRSAAQAMLERALTEVAPGNAGEWYGAQMNALRDRLLAQYGVPGTTAVFSASGTDAEMLALHIALRQRLDDLTNVVIASDEIGSGIAYASLARHFSTCSPLGGPVKPGARLEGFPHRLIHKRSVELRDADGCPRPLFEVDAELAAVTRSEVDSGRRILLHLVDFAKTGVGGPSLESVHALAERHADRMDVLVDACQFRCSPDRIRQYLEAGCMVIITGSKFFHGPPFSAALLVPPHLAQADVAVVPQGMAAYSSAWDWPEHWRHATGTLMRAPNWGLLHRWEAAWAEMSAFAAVPEATKLLIVGRFNAGVAQAARRQPRMRLLPTAMLRDTREMSSSASWDSIPTVFNLSVYSDLALQCPLDLEQARMLHRWMYSRAAAALPQPLSSAQRMIADTRFLLGQPVRYANGPSGGVALRIALSAADVVDMHNSGGSASDVQREVQCRVDLVEQAMHKLCMLIEHCAILANWASPPRAPEPEGRRCATTVR